MKDPDALQKVAFGLYGKYQASYSHFSPPGPNTQKTSVVVPLQVVTAGHSVQKDTSVDILCAGNRFGKLSEIALLNGNENFPVLKVEALIERKRKILKDLSEEDPEWQKTTQDLTFLVQLVEKLRSQYRLDQDVSL